MRRQDFEREIVLQAIIEIRFRTVQVLEFRGIVVLTKGTTCMRVHGHLVWVVELGVASTLSLDLCQIFFHLTSYIAIFISLQLNVDALAIPVTNEVLVPKELIEVINFDVTEQGFFLAI